MAVEVDDDERGQFRFANQFQRCAGNGCERAFTAGEKLAEVYPVDLGGVAVLGAVEFVKPQAGTKERGALTTTALSIGRGLVLEQCVQEAVEAVSRDATPVTRPALQYLLKLSAHDSGNFAIYL